MRNVIVTLMIVCLAASAFAVEFNLDPVQKVPVKNVPIKVYENPDTPTQGGDNIGSAVPIPSLPYYTTGTTAGFIDDYDVACTYTGSTSPDVVYSYVPGTDQIVVVDLCGSGYDTKVYILDVAMNVIACNDDYYFADVPCGYYVSKIDGAALTAGITYYIVVDGYGGDFGDYIFNMTEFEICEIVCDPDAVVEGEPHLFNGYEDTFNSGCNDDYGLFPFSIVNWINDDDGLPPYNDQAWICGTSGWHLSPTGGETRDTDWYSIIARENGIMEFTVESEFPTYIFKLAPLDCAIVDVELQGAPDCGLPATLTFPVTAGEEIWLWVGPTTFTGPVTEFKYTMSVSNVDYVVIPNEDRGWGEIKALYK
jgi:hypothetical protein